MATSNSPVSDANLRRLLLGVPLLLFLLATAFAQQAGDEPPASEEGPAEAASAADAEAVAEEGAATEEEDDPLLDLEDPELDMQGFDPTADDDFVPSEDIPADAPIAFPTDI